jgi:membrane protease YdiL (CAAX protease family)
VPGILAAVDALATGLGGTGTVKRIPVIVTGHPLSNLVLATLNYFQVGAVVPLGLLLLSRTGQGMATLGLTKPRWRADIWPGLGIAVASFGVVVAMTIVLGPLMISNSALFVTPTIGHLPKYYILYGVTAAAVTSVTEETLVNGYLLTRLDQLGWKPQWAFALSLALRTSYHVYYGLGFLLTIPFGYFATRSFRKHGRLMPPIIAHFLYDATLFTIAVLVS